ncbi:RrF2 family transcriptional regulator, partial [Streptomyces sp. NPDC059766]|uniref:RrF2 family transcriptional regulator n=1 Tax=Streptomyces sp. NPDC059766 TaxID=3346940 RepID=UPI0036648869
MRLLRSTDLALRVLMRLAVVGGPTPTTREVAEDMGVPYTHTAKIVAELQHMGLLDARRGRGGGLSLTEKGRTAVAYTQQTQPTIVGVYIWGGGGS